MKRAVGLAILLIAAGCAAPAPRLSPDGTLSVKLLAFNDFHGALQAPPTPTRLPAGPDDGTMALPTGGAAWFVAKVRALRGASAGAAVVAAGDLVGGTPLLSSLLDHEPTIEVLNDAGLEFSAVGNHEFDRGIPELRRLQERARFTWLAANVRDRDTGERTFPAWKARRFAFRGGQVEVAFVGAVLRDTPALVNADQLSQVLFLDEADAVNEAVREIRAAGIEAIVLLLHQGGDTDARRFDEPGCPGFRGPVVDILERLDPAVDLVISGHTHNTYVCRQGGRLVTSAGAEGRFLTDIDLAIDARDGEVRHVDARLVPVVNDTAPNPLARLFPAVRPAASVQRNVAQWERQVAQRARRPIGSIVGDLTRVRSEAGESALGSVVADAMLEASAAADRGAARIAFVNNGGLRADLVARDRGLTFEDAFAVHPFGNFLVTLTLTGSQIDTLLETQWQGAGSALQVSRGFQFRWSASAPPGQRIAPGDILLDGEPLDPARPYRVTVGDFLAAGGEGYTVLREGRDRLTGPLDTDVLEAYLRSHSPLAPPAPGRMVRLP